MTSPVKVTNPFYVLLVLSGVVFCITACAYGVMTVRGLEPLPADAQTSSGFMNWLDQHGVRLMAAELAMLAATTVAAMVTDPFWTRRAERKESRAVAGKQPEQTPS